MSEKDLERYAEIILDLEAQLRQAQIVIGEKESRIKEAEDLSWKNWRDREEGYAEMRVTRQERDQAMAQLRQEREVVAELRGLVIELNEEFKERDAASGDFVALAIKHDASEAQVAQLQATISQAREFLEAIVIAFKEPDGGPCFKLRAFAEKQGIYADDLGRDRVMLRIAQAALAQIPKEKTRP